MLGREGRSRAQPGGRSGIVEHGGMFSFLQVLQIQKPVVALWPHSSWSQLFLRCLKLRAMLLETSQCSCNHAVRHLQQNCGRTQTARLNALNPACLRAMSPALVFEPQGRERPRRDFASLPAGCCASPVPARQLEQAVKGRCTCTQTNVCSLGFQALVTEGLHPCSISPQNATWPRALQKPATDFAFLASLEAFF